MAMTIRAATLEDMPSIQQIYAESVLNGVATYEIEPPSLAEMTGRYRTITGNGYPYIVGQSGGEIAGYAYASAFRTRAAYRFLVEDSIYIDPRFRGMGLGRMLLDALVEQCTALGFTQMVAVIGGAHPASIGVHRAAGFSSTGTLKGSGWKFGRWLDTELMQLALGSGAGDAPAQGEYPDTLYRS